MAMTLWAVRVAAVLVLTGVGPLESFSSRAASPDVVSAKLDVAAGEGGRDRITHNGGTSSVTQVAAGEGGRDRISYSSESSSGTQVAAGEGGRDRVT
jgi:hypothetical protein